MGEIIADEINKYLLEDEKVLWTGKPDSEMLLSDYARSIGCIFFTIFIAGFICKPIASIYRNGFDLQAFIIGIFIPVVTTIILWCFVFGDINVRKYTMYAITDKRILVIIGGGYEQVIEKYINNLTDVYIAEIEKPKPGKGTIVFGDFSFQTLDTKDYRRDKAKKYSYIGDIPIFNDIDDVSGVYAMIRKLIDKK